MNTDTIQIQNLKLIDGEFFPSDANEIISDVIKRKINFHSLKTIGADEKYGETDAYSVRRINELRIELQNLEDIVKSAENEGKRLKIKAIIDIELV